MIPKGSGPRLCILGKSATAKEHEGGDQEARGTGQSGAADQGIPGKDGQEAIPARRTRLQGKQLSGITNGQTSGLPFRPLVVSRPLDSQTARKDKQVVSLFH